MVKMKDWNLNTRLAATAAGMVIIFLMFFGLAVQAGIFQPEQTVSEICDRNLEREVNGIAIGVKIFRVYTDDRFEKICDKHFQKKELENKIRIQIDLDRLEKAWQRMENKNE